MKKEKSGNALLIVLLIVVVLAFGLIYLAKKNNQPETISNSNTATYQATAGNTNSDLGKDMNSIDSSLKNVNDDQTNVNSGINDTPIPQP